MTEIRFVVLGRPQQKGSKRPQATPSGRMFVRDANPKAKPWAAQISAAAREAYSGDLIREAIEIEAGFFFSRPKGHFGSGRNAGTVLTSAPRHMIVMPDTDKICRTVLDALTGIVFKDDSQVTRLVAVKGYGEPERAEIVIRA